MVKCIALLVCLFSGLLCSTAHATSFTQGQVLTAAELNSAFATADITGGTIDGAIIGGSVPSPGAFTTFAASQSTVQTTGAYAPFNFLLSVTPTGNTTALVSGATSSIVYNSANNEQAGGVITPVVASITTQGTGALDKIVGASSQATVDGGNVTSAVGFESAILGIASTAQVSQYTGFRVPGMSGVANIGNVQNFIGFDAEDQNGAVETVGYMSNVSVGAGKYAFLGNSSAQSLFNGPVTTAAGEFTTFLNATGQITSTLATGTAPFVVASTTNVPNLNASSLNGATFASPGPIGSATPSSGAFTTVTASGAITPSQTAGIVGTTTNNNANSGSVGEYVSSSVASGSAIALTSGVTANVTSVSLTAGDWRCDGVAAYHSAASTTESNYTEGISTTSATLGALGSYLSHSSAAQTPSTAPDEMLGTPRFRISIAATTTVYLVVQTTFSVSTMSAYGTLQCTRVR